MRPIAKVVGLIAGERKEFALHEGDTCRLGRNATNDLPLPSPAVSRHHAMVQPGEGASFVLCDLGSSNGTYLNGQRVRVPTALRHDDLIQIGEFSLAFLLESESSMNPDGSISGPAETTIALQTCMTSVLVMDIQGYTTLSREIGETRIGQVMSAFNREASQVLERLGSWGQKYMGDAIMSVWVHQPHQKPVTLALAMLECLSRVAAVAASMQGRFHLETPFRAGYGYATGPASVGNVGGSVASDHTALGEVVNRAFRLESATRQLGCDIALGEETWAAIAGAAAVGGLGTPHNVMLKGYQEETLVYAVNLGAVTDLISRLRAAGVSLGSLDRAGVERQE